MEKYRTKGKIIVILTTDSGRHPMSAHWRDNVNNGGVHNTKECKLKSQQGAGPSRQEVMEAYLIMPDINEDRPYDWRKRKAKTTKPKLHRVRSEVEEAEDASKTKPRAMSKGDDIEEVLMNMSLPDKAMKQLMKTISNKDMLEDVFLNGVIPDDVFEESGRSWKTELNDSLKNSIGAEYFRHELEKVIQEYGEECLVNRFKRIARTVINMLRLVSTLRQRQRPVEKDWKFLSWTLVYDHLGLHRRDYDKLGLTFDLTEFKLNRETRISPEAREILCIEPPDRTREDRHVAMKSLQQTVEAFCEFPIKMQKSLVRVGWYEQFEGGRVIIRQGHIADNFYMILSGTAVVTILDTDKVTGEQYVHTANILEKGYCFGELALMHQARRSATVTCRDSVELLAVGRQDFIEIFMKAERGKIPEHLKFLRDLEILRGWPTEKVPHNNPKACIYLYVRRDYVLCKDSNTSDWIYIIMTGSCRVLKSLHAVKPSILKSDSQTPYPSTSASSRTSLLGSTSPTSHSQDSSPTPSNQPPKKVRRHAKIRTVPALGDFKRSRTIPVIKVRTDEELRQQNDEHLQKLSNVHNRLHPKMSIDDHKKVLEAVFDERRLLPPIDAHLTSLHGNALHTRVKHKNTETSSPDIFIEVAKLGPGDIFGLEQVLMSGIRDTTSTSLISDGAECILLNRKFFRRFLSEDVAKRMRTEVRPLPSEDVLQRKLQNQIDWEAFRHMTVNDQLAYKQHVDKTVLKY